MKVALVVIGRLENRYAVEFVEYYKQLGIDTIFIVDNNYDGEEYFEDVLQKYIDEKFIYVLHYRNNQEEYLQVNMYIKIYQKFKTQFDWFMFFDFDEFLTLTEDKNIKDYLSRDCFKDKNQILINWKIYTDNNLIYDDGRPCLERFTTPMDIYKCVGYKNIAENMHVKCILRGNINSDIIMKDPHHANGTIINQTSCNNKGDIIPEYYCGPWQEINYELAYIKHFTTKTIDEWFSIKYKKGVGDRDLESFFETYPKERFFKYNDITDEKLNYLKDKGIKINFDELNHWYEGGISSNR